MCLDHEAIEELKDAMEEEFPLLIDEFASRTPEILEELEAAINTSNHGNINVLAHSLRGSASNVGAAVLSELCLIMETAAKEKQDSDYPVMLQEISNCYTQTIDGLRKYL